MLNTILSNKEDKENEIFNGQFKSVGTTNS